MTPGRKTLASRRILMASMMILCLACLLAAVAQQAQEEETTRHLWDTAFINQTCNQETGPAELSNCDSSCSSRGRVTGHSHRHYALAIASIQKGGCGRKDHCARRSGVNGVVA